MRQAISDYCSRLAAGFGAGWNRFWFTPAAPETLAVIRIGTGLIVCYLHATLALDLVALFGPNGLLPADEIAPLEGSTVSYLNVVSTPAELWTVHLIGLAILVLFTIGFYTRLTSVLALIVLVSDVSRAPMITSITEPVAAMCLLYLCLAPCGARYSLDALLARKQPHAPLATRSDELSTMTNIATRLIQVHLALLVAMMAFSKLASEVWWTGTGIWWLLARPGTRLVDLTGLTRWSMAIDVWTHLIVLFELSFPLLVWNRLARPLMLAWAVLMWWSLAVVTGDFPFAAMLSVAALAFVPPQTVSELLQRQRPAVA